MRVVGGKLRGKRLGSFKGFDIRPTTDRVREALFNLLGTRVALAGVPVLDLFAGTGAVGIEALSRGAASACFVESDRRAVAVIGKNLKACRLEEQALILKSDAAAAVQGLAGRGKRFGLIFLDPPYASSVLSGIVALIAGTALLAPEGVLAAETAKKAPLLIDGEEAKPGAKVGSFGVDEVRRYGDTLLYLLSYTGGSVADGGL